MKIKMKIFVGNLSFNVTETDLRRAFETFGQVIEAIIVKDSDSQRSKGFGFVEMPKPSEARAAIMALNGQALKGRTITTNEARTEEDDRRTSYRGDPGDRRGKGRY